MLSFVGLRFAAFGQPITSNEIRRMNPVGPIIVHIPPTPLAICPAPPPQSPNSTLASSPSACYCALSPPSLAIEIAPSLSSPKLTLAPSPSADLGDLSPPSKTLASSTSACPSALSLSATPAPNCSSSPFSSPLGACHCASESIMIAPLPKLTEADFDIFPKLPHEELKKPIRRYGASITPVENKATLIKIDDDDSPSGWEYSLIEDYLLEGDEEKYEEKEENEDDEDWQMELLGIHVVDE